MCKTKQSSLTYKQLEIMREGKMRLKTKKKVKAVSMIFKDNNLPRDITYPVNPQNTHTHTHTHNIWKYLI